MSARFRIDLLNPGRVQQTWQDWFTGVDGRQRLTVFAGATVITLLIAYVIGVHLPSRALSSDQREVARLRQTLAATAEDLRVIRADLGALAEQARRQVRWSELLGTFSEQLPPDLRLRKVSLLKVVPPAPPGQARQAPPPPAEGVLGIEAQTPLRPGGPPLVETARFMAGIMRDPAVSKRFQLKSWEIRPPASAAAAGAPPLLEIRVTFTERLPR